MNKTLKLMITAIVAFSMMIPYLSTVANAGITDESDYIGFLFKGSAGSFTADDEGLHIKGAGSNNMYGVYKPEDVISGHFYAEIDADVEAPMGLALVKKTNGAPDPDNWTAINIYSSNNTIHVQAIDRQNGVDNVLDNTGKCAEKNLMKRYDVALDGRYSTISKHTLKKVRIFHNANTGTFNFFVKYGNTIAGEWTEGWLELAPSQEWNAWDSEYYIVPFVRDSSQTVTYNNLFATAKPMDDQNDTQSPFKAVEREYNWGGHFGNAIVVTFDDRFQYKDEDVKLVFWEENNYVPMWQLTDEIGISTEFVESWDTSSPRLEGCFEPMSERFGRFNSVEIIEDNSVRKIIKWHHVLINPNYEILASEKRKSDENDLYDLGSYTGDLPEVDEYWTIYPDGTTARNIFFYPKLDTNAWNNGHELSEPMLFLNGKGNKGPSAYVPDVVLTYANAGADEKIELTKGIMKQINNNSIKFKDEFAGVISNWEQFIVVNHTNDVSMYSVWNNENNQEYIDGGVYAGYKMDIDQTWHSMDLPFSHFPMNYEYYWLDRDKNIATWNNVPQHASYCGIGQYNARDWRDGSGKFKIDERGRKYREFTTLLGLVDTSDSGLEQAKINSATWIKPGEIKRHDANSCYDGIDYTKKIIEFTRIQDAICYFSITPSEGAVISNPAFCIKEWGDEPFNIFLNNNKLAYGIDYAAEVIEDGSLIVWLNKTIDSRTMIYVTAEDEMNAAEVIPVPKRENLVKNPSFENDMDSWNIKELTNASGACYTETKGPYKGNRNLALWKNSAYEVAAYQNIENLTDGTYTAGAMVRASIKNGDAKMIITGFDITDESKAIEIPISKTNSSNYMQLEIPDIHVTSGKLTMEFYANASGGDWVNVDNAELYKDTGIYLSGLNVSDAKLSPEFDPDTTEYKISVPNETESITVTPVAESTDSVVKVNGVIINNDSSSESIALKEGKNTIKIEVSFPGNPLSNIYWITAERLEEYSAERINLVKNPGFEEGISNWVISSDESNINACFVDNNPFDGEQNLAAWKISDYETEAYQDIDGLENGLYIAKAMVRSSIKNGSAVMKVKGFNIEDENEELQIAIPATEGSSYLPVEIADINITNGKISVSFSAKSTGEEWLNIDNVELYQKTGTYLSGLEISDGVLEPAFYDHTTEYAVNVPYNVSSITLKPTAEDDSSVIRVNGNVVSSEETKPIQLSVGENTIKITVSSKQGVPSRTYTVKVTRKNQVSSALRGNLVKNPGFEDGIANWDIWVRNSSSNGACFIDDNPYDGEKNLAQYKDSSYEISAYQNIEGLEDGVYTARAMVRSNVKNNNAVMEIKEYGGNSLKVAFPITEGDEYVPVEIKNINVSTGKASINFYTKGAADEWIKVDNAEFYKNIDEEINVECSVSAPDKLLVDDEFDVDINISENSYACAGSLKLVYDNTVFALANVRAGDLLSAANPNVNTNNNNAITVSWENLKTPITSEGTILTVTFRALAETPSESEFRLEDCTITDSFNNALIECSVINDTVNVFSGLTQTSYTKEGNRLKFVSDVKIRQPKGVLIVALYKDNNLVGISTEYLANKGTVISYIDECEFDDIKVMVWDSLALMSPVYNFEKVKIK